MAAVHLFNHPVVATLLLALAFLGLVIEVRSPGFQRAGWAGLTALALFVASHLAEGTPAWTTLPLVAGVALLWPALRRPERRLSAVAGTATLAVGAYLVLVGSGPARLDGARALAVLGSAALLVALAAIVVWGRLPASLRPARRLGVFFQTAGGAEAGEGGVERLVGRTGVAASGLRPAGEVVVEGERLPAVVEDGWLAEGAPVRVVGVEGIRARVRAVDAG